MNKYLELVSNSKFLFKLKRFQSFGRNNGNGISVVLFSSSSSTSKIIKSSRKQEKVIGITMVELLEQNLHKWEDAVAFECGVTGRKYKHKEIFKYSSNFATALMQSGLKKGNVIGLVLPNIPEYAIALLGAWKAGLVPTPLNPNYTADEISKQLNDSEAKGIIFEESLLPTIQSVQKQCQSVKSLISVGLGGFSSIEGCHSFFEMIKTNSLGVNFLKGSEFDTENDLALLPYSSGTSGTPKGVMLTHSGLSTNVLQCAESGNLATNSFEGGNPQERLIGILPFFHVFGMSMVLFQTLFCGMHTMTIPKFNPSEFIDIWKRFKPSFIYVAPPIVSFLVSSPEVTKETLASLNGMMSGAASLGPTLAQKMIQKCKKDFFMQEGYGMTELGVVSHLLPPSTKNTKLCSIGALIAGTMAKVVNPETGEDLGPNQQGEMMLKGPQIMKGYFKNDKATKETINEDGWLHTGDIVMYDEQGCFYVIERLKDIIKTKGFQVAPSELEDILRTHPDIEDVAVIGVPHETDGEVPRAYIVLKTPGVREKVIHDFLEKKISLYKRLKGGIEFVPAIPKLPSGKILRRELKKNYLAKYEK